MALQHLNKATWFKSVFDSYYDSIHRFLFFRCGNADLAADLAQEAFVKLWDARDSVREETAASYLYTIAANLLKNHHKHQAVVMRFQNLVAVNDGYYQEADYDIRQQQLQQRLEQTLSEMPEKCRVPFLMNRLEELTYPEIADRMGLSVKAIEKRMSEAIDYLRKNFEYKI